MRYPPVPGLLIVTAVFVTGCGSGVNGLASNAQTLPMTNAGQSAYPPPASLTPVPFSADDWSGVERQKVAVACDTRGPKPVADAASVATAKEIIEKWSKAGGGSVGGEVKVSAGGSSVTVSVAPGDLKSLSFECGGEHAELAANGTAIPFDLAYVTRDRNAGKPANEELMLTAYSLKSGSLVVVIVKPWTKVATLDATDLRTYVGEAGAEPVVRDATGPAGLFLEQNYFFKPAAAGTPGTYVTSLESGTSSKLSVGRFSLQP